MTLQTTIGEDDRDIGVDFDYQPAERDTNTPEGIIINEVWCIEHERQTGLRADESALLSDDDNDRILSLCWDAVREAKETLLEQRWEACRD